MLLAFTERKLRPVTPPIHVDVPEGATQLQKGEALLDAALAGECDPQVAASLIAAMSNS